jgi:hypothetical protein
MNKLIIVPIFLLLGGCLGMEKPVEASTPPIVPGCPDAIKSLPAYSQAFQRQAAGEMRAAGPNAAWPRLVSDWGYWRQKIRALCK